MPEQDTKPEPPLTGTAYVHAVVSKYLAETKTRPMKIYGTWQEPQLHDPALVRRALKRLTGWKLPAYEHSVIPVLIRAASILNLIVTLLVLTFGRSGALMMIQEAYVGLMALLAMFWAAGNFDRRHLSAPHDVWYITPDGRVETANDQAFNCFERRRLFRFTKETCVTLPNGESVFRFKEEPNILTVQEIIDLMVRIESAKDYVDRHSVTGPYRRVRVEDTAFRVSTEPPPIELMSAEELERRKKGTV